MFILVEHKSSPWWRCVFDLLRYVVHFWERWLDANPRARMVPPIVTLVVHHGRRSWNCAESLQALIDLQGLPETGDAMLVWLPELRFMLHDLSRLGHAQLRAMPLPAIVKVGLLAMQPGRNLGPAAAAQALVLNRDLVQQVLRSPGGRAAMEPVWSYLAKVSDLPPAELARTIASISPTAETSFMSTYDQIVKKAKAEERSRFRSTYDQIVEKAKAEAKAEGKAEGEAEGKAALLLRLLRRRFGPLTASVVGRVQRGSNAELDRWGELLLHAATLRAVFASRRPRAAVSLARAPRRSSGR